jgi:hypothetical protein
MPRRRKPRHARHAQRDTRDSRKAPGYEGTREIGGREVEDPYDPDNTILVPANLRHDPLLRMYQRREIDEAQLRAGETLRNSHEAVASQGLKAIDPSLDVVDGGRASIAIPESALLAARRIREAQSLLGWQAYRLVTCVVCEGIHGSMIAELTTARLDRKFVGLQLRLSLEQLAILWGMIQDPKRVRRHASIVGMVRDRASWIHDETDLLIRYGE